MKVRIEQKLQNGKINQLEGIIKEILTDVNFDPFGIMVKLENGVEGHVKEILGTTMQPLDIMKTSISELKIPKEEDLHNEFKSSFRFNVKRFEEGDGKKAPDKEVEKEVSIAIACFANTEGGKLFIGVRDDGTTFGLDYDFELLKNPNLDKFQRILWQSIQNHLQNMIFVSSIRIQCIEKDKTIICIVEVPPSKEPILVNDGRIEEAYVRIGPKCEKFSFHDFLRYSKSRF